VHDRSIMDSLLRKIAAISEDHDAPSVTGVRVRLGAVSHMDEAHFRAHWADATNGTPLAAATVEVELSPEPFGLLLVDVELEA
jgi:Zn finger protein HypA/HybF involved in hydrogenase expression